MTFPDEPIIESFAKVAIVPKNLPINESIVATSENGTSCNKRQIVAF